MVGSRGIFSCIGSEVDVLAAVSNTDFWNRHTKNCLSSGISRSCAVVTGFVSLVLSSVNVILIVTSPRQKLDWLVPTRLQNTTHLLILLGFSEMQPPQTFLMQDFIS